MDANILIRAVLGPRARSIILKNADRTAFFAPEVAYDDARKYLPALAAKRGAGPEVAARTLEVLDAFEGVVLAVARETYEVALLDAESRLEGRDPDDWPILAAATVLVVRSGLRTKLLRDGVPTWTTDRVELYLNNTD